jgi:L-erythro-3,5-diaminohexanoate dehydrogenase
MPQPAARLDNDMSRVYDNEILVDVSALNIDSASFAQLEGATGGDLKKLEAEILSIVSQRGKMQNPVTGSGGMFIGTVAKIGPALAESGMRDLAVGDRIASLVSLSLTPLNIAKIIRIRPEIDRVEIEGQAILFESGIYAKLPTDMGEGLALAALDVAGAPAQAAKLVKPGQSVLILGAGGKSGMLVAYEAMKRAGPTGRVVGNVYLPEDADMLKALNVCHEIIIEDASKPIALLHRALAANDGAEYDVVFNCVNVPNTEMATILPCRQEGTAYFFSMATHFGKAALGAEGVGKDITMIVGNGFTKGHAEITLAELREHKGLRELFEKKYV